MFFYTNIQMLIDLHETSYTYIFEFIKYYWLLKKFPRALYTLFFNHLSYFIFIYISFFLIFKCIFFFMLPHSKQWSKNLYVLCFHKPIKIQTNSQYISFLNWHHSQRITFSFFIYKIKKITLSVLNE